jgi:Flp pilus assembly protein TadG
MISRSVLKVVTAIGTAGFVAIDLGSPVMTWALLDGAANDAAQDALQRLVETRGDQAQAGAEAQRVAAERDAALRAFGVDPVTGAVSATVGREASSVLFKRWGRLKGWYDVEVTATARRRAG